MQGAGGSRRAGSDGRGRAEDRAGEQSAAAGPTVDGGGNYAARVQQGERRSGQRGQASAPADWCSPTSAAAGSSALWRLGADFGGGAVLC